MTCAGVAEALEREQKSATGAPGNGEAQESTAAPGAAVNGAAASTGAAAAPATGLDPPLAGDSHLRRGPAAARCLPEDSKQVTGEHQDPSLAAAH